MEQKYFYVKPDDTIPPSLPADLIYDININDINALALFSTTLDPEPEITEAFGYSAALYTYYSQNSNDLKDCYLKLVSNSRGQEFLCSTISLCLYEKMFREKGISMEMIEKYNNSIENYRKQLVVNNQNYDNQQSIGKKL